MIELTLKAFLNDFKMQKPKEATAEAETECRRGFHFKGERRIVETQLAHGRAQVFKVGGINREQSTEHDRLRRLEA